MRDVSAAAPRPVLHFTPERGWVNDPHGLVYADGRYHVFFQLNEHDRVWASAISWGHATSPDLFHWRQQPVALTPLPDETGCWTGAVVRARGAEPYPVIVYTSVVGTDVELGIGRVALAHGDVGLSHWRRDDHRFVVDGAPPVDGDSVHSFRDPCVWWQDDRWVMVVGAGLRVGGGAVLQYTSDDLEHWTYDGVLLDAATVAAAVQPGLEQPRLGTTWECPQLFALDGSWVLLVSVWDDGELCHVAAAVGDYDGRRLTPRSWARFSHDDLLYATTAFLDEDRRRCVISWLRELPGPLPIGQPWAGALSLPYVLRLEGDRLAATVHPGIAAIRGPSLHATRAVSCPPGVTVRLTLSGDGTDDVLGSLVLTSDSVAIQDAEHRQLAAAPLEPSAGYTLSLVVDGDIVEVTTSTMRGILAARIPSLRSGRPLGVATRIRRAADV